jgi:hypothetical protein
MFSEIAHEYIQNVAIKGKLHKYSLVVLTALVAGLKMGRSARATLGMNAYPQQ